MDAEHAKEQALMNKVLLGRIENSIARVGARMDDLLAENAALELKNKELEEEVESMCRIFGVKRVEELPPLVPASPVDKKKEKKRRRKEQKKKAKQEATTEPRCDCKYIAPEIRHMQWCGKPNCSLNTADQYGGPRPRPAPSCTDPYHPPECDGNH